MASNGLRIRVSAPKGARGPGAGDAECMIASMSDKPKISVNDAYALETPADNIDLYKRWAGTYDSEFAEREGYVLYLRVSELLLQRKSLINGPVLDVGCGTGLVGQVLREGGLDEIDGIDISPEMLAEAGKKTTFDGAVAYRNMIPADLTKTIDIADNQYGALISAGTFTHGHLGPESLDEPWRVAAPGALCVIGVRSTHYEAMGFKDKFEADVANGTITQPETVIVNVYSDDARNAEHADDEYYVIICQVV